jgi:DNA (cytosine-5)-methyltransferase 1
MAHRDGGRREQRDPVERSVPVTDAHGATLLMADTESHRAGDNEPERKWRSAVVTKSHGETIELADAKRGTTERRGHDVGGAAEGTEGEAQQREWLRVNPWAGCKFIPCRDGKARPVEPGTFPLAHGIPARVGRLRAYGNAINPWVAAAFIGESMTAIEAFTARRAA